MPNALVGGAYPTATMTILVCPLSKVAEVVAGHAPGRVVSLLDPGSTVPELGPRYLGRHLRLAFHDVHVPIDGQVVPAVEHIVQLINFVAAWDRGEPLLVHCRAGIGRSPAAAFIVACFCNPGTLEREIAVSLRRVAPLARPNETLIRLADDVLGRNGRMSAAIASTGRNLPEIDVDEGEPFRMPSAGER
jgi:predicted protein tyrosine phosphatase